LRHDAEVLYLTFSHDDLWLASASRDGTVKVWDTRSGRPASEPLLHPRAVTFTAFGPDARRLLTASDDKRARLWDWRSGRLAASPMAHELYIRHLTIDPTATRAVTIDEALTAHLWDLANGQRINLPGRQLLPAPARVDSSARWAWDAPADERPATELVSLTQLLSGRRIDGANGLLPLDREQLKILWRELERK
jgi:WD40 repeat protein